MSFERYTREELRSIGTPAKLFIPGGDGYSVIADGLKWVWDASNTEDDDGIRYILPKSHQGAGRFVLEGDVTYKSFNIVDSKKVNSNEGIKAYWQYCIDHDLPFTLGAITVLITENNIFGQFGNRAVRRKIIKGLGRNETTIIFQPRENDQLGEDGRYFLYDGGDGLGTNNSSRLLNQSFSDISLLLDTSKMDKKNSVGVYRLSDSENQNFEFKYCRISGDGATPQEASLSKNCETFFYQLVGNVNTSENKCLFCEINYLTHVCHFNNPQGVDQSFIECDVWLIYNHFFVISKGGLEIRISGGSWIWHDQPDVDKQYLFYIPDSSGVGKGNLLATITSFKPEMRNKGAALVAAIHPVGSIFINFISCNFLGGGLNSTRDMLLLSLNKRVSFDQCAIPDSMGIMFKNINPLHANSYDLTGLVLFTSCGFEKDISHQITHDAISGCGRVIADDFCHGIIGENKGIKEKFAFAFDSNPFDSGKGMPGYTVKKINIKTRQDPWPWKGSELSVTLPKGAMLFGITLCKPPLEHLISRKKYTLNVSNGDKSKMYSSVTATENEGFFIEYRVPLHMPIYCHGDNERRVKIWETNGGFSTYTVEQGYCTVHYI